MTISTENTNMHTASPKKQQEYQLNIIDLNIMKSPRNYVHGAHIAYSAFWHLTCGSSPSWRKATVDPKLTLGLNMSYKSGDAQYDPNPCN